MCCPHPLLGVSQRAGSLVRQSAVCKAPGDYKVKGPYLKQAAGEIISCLTGGRGYWDKGHCCWNSHFRCLLSGTTGVK